MTEEWSAERCAERAEAVAATLDWLASGWLMAGDSPEEEDNQRWLRDIAVALRRVPLLPMIDGCCPCCEEVVCDEDCPLYPVRDAYGIWIGSTANLRADESAPAAPEGNGGGIPGT